MSERIADSQHRFMQKYLSKEYLTFWKTSWMLTEKKEYVFAY